jgi:hypothetical protein
MTFNMGGLPSPTFKECERAPEAPYDEKDDPQPQERVEFGLMKLNP